MTVADNQAAPIGTSHVLVFADILAHLVFNGHSQHLLGPLPENVGQNIPAGH
jgi:hypothetical protein